MIDFEIKNSTTVCGVVYYTGIATYKGGSTQVITITKGNHDLWKFKKDLTADKSKEIDEILQLLNRERDIENSFD